MDDTKNTEHKTISKFYKNIKAGDFNPFIKTKKSVIELYNDFVAIPSGGVHRFRRQIDI